jgi:hypothetical protein
VIATVGRGRVERSGLNYVHRGLLSRCTSIRALIRISRSRVSLLNWIWLSRGDSVVLARWCELLLLLSLHLKSLSGRSIYSLTGSALSAQLGD